MSKISISFQTNNTAEAWGYHRFQWSREKWKYTHAANENVQIFLSVVFIKIQWMDDVDGMFITSRMSVFHIIQFSPHCAAAHHIQPFMLKKNRKWKKNWGLAFVVHSKGELVRKSSHKIIQYFQIINGCPSSAIHTIILRAVVFFFSHSSCLRLRFHNCFRFLTHKMCSKIIANTLNYPVGTHCYTS